MTDLLAAAEIAEAAALDLANRPNIDPTDPERPGLADLDSALYAVVNATKALRDVKEHLEDVIGEAMDDRRVTVNGRTLERHKKTVRTQWDKEALRFAVADSRLVNKDTGEVVDETPIDKILHVFQLPAPRLTALKERGLEPDDFAHVEHRPGWTLKVV